MKWMLCGAGLGLLLAGCADPQLGDLQQQLAEVRNGKVLPESLALPAVTHAPTLDYSLGDRRSPFRPQRLEPEAVTAAGGELMPDLERVREPLEAYELEALQLVGVLVLGGVSYGLVRVPSGEVHRVQAGNYLGRRYGQVVDISDRTIQLVELVPEGGRGWTERSASLALVEAVR